MGKKKEVTYYNDRLQGKYLTDEVCNKLESLRRLDKEKGYVSDLKNMIYDLPPSDVELIKSSGTNELVDFEGKRGTLENLQTIGVAYMYFAKRMILGDSVGLGKTVEVCGLCNLLESVYMNEGKDFKFLMLTEKTIVPQVRDEMIKFTGNYVEAVYGEKQKVQRFVDDNYTELMYSVVGTHSLMKSVDFQEYIRSFKLDTGCCPFDLLIIDESGVLANSGTQMYKDAKFLASLFDRIILLNATSFEKELRSFYNQLDFVDDSLLPTKTEFQKTYEIMDYYGPYPTFSGKYRNADQFRQLVGYRYFARTRKSAGAKMEGCSADVIVVTKSAEQRELLKKTSMPQMVYDCPSYFKMGVETNEHTTPKLKALLKLLTDDLVNEESILVYTLYKEAQFCIKEALEWYGISSEILNGDSSQQEREDVINKFKLGDFRVLITNVQKGLNFGHCNNCIFYTYDSNPNRMVQFEGRMTRSFDIKNKHVYLLISKGDELKNFKKIIAERAEASDLFAGSDFSCVLSILLDSDRLSKLK